MGDDFEALAAEVPGAGAELNEMRPRVIPLADDSSGLLSHIGAKNCIFLLASPKPHTLCLVDTFVSFEPSY